MTKKELFRALDDNSLVEVVDVIARDVYPGRIIAVRVCREADGTRRYVPEVADPCGHCIMRPRLENVRIAKSR